MGLNTSKTSRWARTSDRLAQWGITVGGVMIIATVVLILLLILNVSIPLFKSSTIQTLQSFQLAPNKTEETLAVGLDDYREIFYTISTDAHIRFYDGHDGVEIDRQGISPPGSATDTVLVDAESWGSHQYTLQWNSGHISAIRIRLTPIFDDQGNRSISYLVNELGIFDPPAQGHPIQSKVRIYEDGQIVIATQITDTSVEIRRITTTENFMGEVDKDESIFQITSELPGAISAIELDEAGENLYLGTDEGFLSWWDISDASNASKVDVVHINNTDAAVTSLQLVFGDVSIAVGTADGTVSTYFATRNAAGNRTKLRRIHALLEVSQPITTMTPTRRDKSMFIRSEDGQVHIVQATSEKLIAAIPSPKPIDLFALSTRGDTVISLDDRNTITLWDFQKLHPEATLKTLFSKVWYEKYDTPEYVWQSSASSDDYEPKFSLIPLIYGSFKGTLYAMIFSVPLALFGALYTNQFLSPGIRAVVKPAVEIMASIPSVVIGFLVALWLAPLIEDYIVTFLISLVVLPLTILPFIYLGHLIDGTSFYRKIERGYEFILAVPIILLGTYLSFLLGPIVESTFFDNDFTLWMYESLGTRYDQRNAIVIAFGLGFVSIPIIYTITEDALSNLPQSLRAASLALGASRWQTAWRVVLPSASPGIFAAVIIGFGRVIGETMIVLMATGNTPIMDWSPFNGMRTLSANIAVEIPEAPLNGTLYRVLFLSAALLFMLTFILNTAAELIRQRLRNKYGRFQ